MKKKNPLRTRVQNLEWQVVERERKIKILSEKVCTLTGIIIGEIDSTARAEAVLKLVNGVPRS